MQFIPLKNMTSARIVVPQVRGVNGKSLIFEPGGTETVPQSAMGHPALIPHLRSVPPRLVPQVEVVPVPVPALAVAVPKKVVVPVPVVPPPPPPPPPPEVIAMPVALATDDPEPEPTPEPTPEPDAPVS